MFRRHHSFAVRGLCALALVTGVVSAAGCSDEEQATPRVTFDSTVTPGLHSTKECGKTGPWFQIGSFGNPALGRKDPANPESELIEPVRPVEDGASDQQGEVTINCSVTEKGDGFEVRASSQLTGATGGSVTITGLFRPTGEQQDITVSLTKRGETFSSSKCVARYDTLLGHGVAAGRVWAQVECADAATRDSEQICKSTAQFRFENCSQ